MTSASRRIKRPAAKFDPSGFVRELTIWAKDKALAESLAPRYNALRDVLKPLVMKYGELDPETGSRVLKMPEGTTIEKYGKVDAVVAQRSAGTRTLDADRAEDFLVKRGAELIAAGSVTRKDGNKTVTVEVPSDLDLLAEAQTTITVLDEDKILALHFKGLLTEQEVDDLYNIGDDSYSFTIKKATG